MLIFEETNNVSVVYEILTFLNETIRYSLEEKEQLEFNENDRNGEKMKKGKKFRFFIIFSSLLDFRNVPMVLSGC